MPTIAFVKKFRKEFEDHLEGRPCPYEKEGAVEELPCWRINFPMADVTLTVDSKKITAPAGGC